MNFFARRNLRKQIKQVLHDAHHARHLRGDVASPDAIETLQRREQELEAAWKLRDYAAVEAAAERVMMQTSVVYPPRDYPHVREYVEILVVALAVAMAVRTYFVQPFKIPTGSMQPTLYGITAVPQVGPKWYDRVPLNLVSLVVFGDRYQEVRAAQSGTVERLARDESHIYSLNGVVPRFRVGMAQHFEMGERVVRGQLLASGRVRAGDHIFVNKIRYNFSRPQRGDVFVFNTEKVNHPHVKQDTFYIKRLVALPGERVRLAPPELLVNGVPVREPAIFERIMTDQAAGYTGYVFPPYGRDMPLPVMAPLAGVLQLGDTEYLPLGDNTSHSLDGRYFGGIPRDNIVGPAVVVYWPLSPRWGWIR